MFKPYVARDTPLQKSVSVKLDICRETYKSHRFTENAALNSLTK